MGLNFIKKLRKKQGTRSPPEPLEEAESVAVEKLDQEDIITPQTTDSTSSENDEFAPVADVTHIADEVYFNDPGRNSKQYSGITNRDGVPVISSSNPEDHFRASDVMGGEETKTGFKDLRSTTVPSLRDSAYSGPVRYDWVDVESAAAIKVQSIYRRNRVITQLEKEGKLTASMRNKMRSRKSRKTNKVSEDVPALFRFCGIGFLFNDALGGDSDALNAKEKSKSEDNKQLRLAQDEMNRRYRMRNKRGERVDEAIEVVDDNVEDNVEDNVREVV